ncbi:hypothetical protein ACHAXN_002972 [Cyclotella atomus]
MRVKSLINVMPLATSRSMLVLLALFCLIIVSPSTQAAAAPKELIDVFGSWIENAATIKEIQTALQSGKIVVIHDAFKPDMYDKLQSEITSVQYSREPRSTPLSHIEQIGSSTFFDVPRDQVCGAVDRLYGSDPINDNRTFFFSHNNPISFEGFRTTIKLKGQFQSPSVRRWVAFLLGEENESVEYSTMGARCLNEGDVYGSHNDDLEGRFGGLSFTSYFTQTQWKSEWGGNFVWCADPREPITIPPLSNTIVLFRVSETTWHHVQPLLKGSPPRYVLQVWWFLKPEVSKLRRLLLTEPSNRSMVVIDHVKDSNMRDAKRILEALQMAHALNEEEL